MIKSIISNPVDLSAKSSKKHTEKDSDKRYPKPEDYNEEKGPPIKEMPVKDNRDREENQD